MKGGGIECSTWNSFQVGSSGGVASNRFSRNNANHSYNQEKMMNKRNSSSLSKTIKGLHLGRSGVGGLVLLALTLSVRAAIYDIDVSDLTLYSDPGYPTREIKLGGFSGLYPVPGDKTHTMFYTVTDRGPTQDMEVETPPLKTTYKVLPCHDMAPMIVKLQICSEGAARVLEVIPLRKEVSPGQYQPITGSANGVELSPEALTDPYYKKLAYDPDALDPEGITMDKHGFFWICEEYRPSVAMVDANGTVLLRIVPKGSLSLLETEIVDTYELLPAVLRKRVNNRGMEGITYAPNGCLYAIVQRPLANPSKAVSEASANLRIVEINLKAILDGNPQPAVRQFIYRTETVNAKAYASDLFAINPAILLVPERATDKLFAINISVATDITPFESEDGTLIADPTKTIEQLDEAGLAQLGIRPVEKTTILPTMIGLHKELAKCEGLCVAGGNLVLTYDNDFNLADLGDGTTKPGAIVLKSPDVYPALITLPFMGINQFK